MGTRKSVQEVLLRSADIKIHRTDGSSNTNKDERLTTLRASLLPILELATEVVLLHDHKGFLDVYHFGELQAHEKDLIRTLWAAYGEPKENVAFISLGIPDAFRS